MIERSRWAEKRRQIGREREQTDWMDVALSQFDLLPHFTFHSCKWLCKIHSIMLA
jgi:hypothetical protein